MIATEVLRRNHLSILELFARYRRSGRCDPPKKKALFGLIKRAVRMHLSLEEEMLYPAMIRKPSPEAGQALDDVLQEHLQIDDLLDSLSNLDAQDREFDRKMTSLKERVERHLLKEQNGPYGEARRTLRREKLEKLGAEISARLDLLSRAAYPN